MDYVIGRADTVNYLFIQHTCICPFGWPGICRCWAGNPRTPREGLSGVACAGTPGAGRCLLESVPVGRAPAGCSACDCGARHSLRAAEKDLSKLPHEKEGYAFPPVTVTCSGTGASKNQIEQLAVCFWNHSVAPVQLTRAVAHPRGLPRAPRFLFALPAVTVLWTQGCVFCLYLISTFKVRSRFQDKIKHF